MKNKFGDGDRKTDQCEMVYVTCECQQNCNIAARSSDSS